MSLEKIQQTSQPMTNEDNQRLDGGFDDEPVVHQLFQAVSNLWRDFKHTQNEEEEPRAGPLRWPVNIRLPNFSSLLQFCWSQESDGTGPRSVLWLRSWFPLTTWTQTQMKGTKSTHTRSLTPRTGPGPVPVRG